MSKTLARPASRRVPGSSAARLIVVLGIVGVVALRYLGLGRREVEGRSMLPTLAPGDRVLMRRRRTREALTPGMIIGLVDPRGGREVIKRIASIHGDQVVVLGDNPAESTDSRHFGPVDQRAITSVFLRRYSRPDAREQALGSR